MEIQKEDIIEVAETLNITLTETEIDNVLSIYESEADNDPTATWDLVVENCIYNVINDREN